jgi:hypothetical protein
VGLAITVDSSVTVSHLAVIINTGQGNKGRLALYADEENRPGALLVGTEYQALNKGRNFFPVNDITIPAGIYWIVAHYDDFVGVSAYTDGESYTQFGRMTADGEFPDPIPNLKGYPGWQMNYDLLGY